jgi:tetratricopeptide (TPR) repeat protein
MADNMHPTLSKAIVLLEKECYESAEFLCTSLLSTVNMPTHTQALATECLADTYFHRKQFRRAANFYGQCTTLVNDGRSSESFGTTMIVSIKIKKSKCLVALNDSTGAIQELETIPVKQKTTQVYMTLGRLYQSLKSKRSAINSFKAALALEPLALEVYEILTLLGVDSSELMPYVKNAMKKSENLTFQVEVWLPPLLKMLISRQLSDAETCVQECNRIESALFPGAKPIFLLRVLAEVAAAANKPQEAMDLYRQIRRLDEHCLDSMDDFGMLLYEGHHEAELNKLANELLAVDDKRDTGWLVAAMYCALKEETDKAKLLTDRVIQMRPQNACAYNLKGKLLIGAGSTEQAIIAFSQANQLSKDVRTMSNLVAAQLAANKVKDATNTARETVVLCPQSPTSHILLGQCLARSTTPSVLIDGIKCFQKALGLDKANVQATALISEAYAVQDRNHEAVAYLLSTLEASPTVEANCLRMQLARCYARLEKYSAAIEQLHMVIELDPGAGDAVLELERLEQELGGRT